MHEGMFKKKKKIKKLKGSVLGISPANSKKYEQKPGVLNPLYWRGPAQFE